MTDDAVPVKIEISTANHAEAAELLQQLTEAHEASAIEGYSTKSDHTDLGNANLMTRFSDGTVRWVRELRTWAVWNGERWEQDQDGVVMARLSERVALHYQQEAAGARELAKKCDDSAEAERFEKIAKARSAWEKCCRERARINAMQDLLKSRPGIGVSFNEFDAEPWMLGVANGVVNLRTGELLPPDRDRLMFKFCPFEYDPKAEAPTFERALAEMMKEGGINRHDRRVLCRYIRRLIGYAATGQPTRNLLLIFVGVGSNGKSILREVLLHVLGPYARVVPAEVLMARGGGNAEGPTPFLAQLKGARLIVVNESAETARLNEAQVKQVTGGDTMTARVLHGMPFEMRPTWTVILSTNHLPRVGTNDKAIWDRLAVLNFTQRWNRPDSPQERDPTLPDGDPHLLEKLKAEAPGILRWMVEGAVEFARDGLKLPDEVRDASAEYRIEQDMVAQWIEAHCELGKGMACASMDVYRSYVNHVTLAGEQPMSQRSLTRHLTQHYKITQQRTMRARLLHGIRMRTLQDDLQVCRQNSSDASARLKERMRSHKAAARGAAGA